MFLILLISCKNSIISVPFVRTVSVAIRPRLAHFRHELLEEVNTTLQMMEPEELPAALKHLRVKMLAK